MPQLEDREFGHDSCFLNKSHSNAHSSTTRSIKLNITNSVLLFVVYITFIVSVILNIPVVRQVLGFISLTFIPGFAILKILKVKKITTIEILLFSVGLSIAYVMVIGFLTNELLPLLGIMNPLSEFNVALTINSTVLLLLFLDFLVNRKKTSVLSKVAGIHSVKTIKPLILFSLTPLTIAGVFLVNTYNNSFVIMMMMIIVLIAFFSVLFFGREHKGFYSMALLAIATALVFQRSLISNYIFGSDIHREYYILRTTANNLRWSRISFPGDLTLAYSSFNSMLSVTILPTIYSALFNIEETWILKIVYPLIYSLLPVALYQLHQKHTGKHTAFLSAFFFMANFDVFLQPIYNAKQMIAELFFVLLLIVIFSKKENSSWAHALLISLLGIGLITSHYGTSYIFLLLVGVTWLYGLIRKRDTKIASTSVFLFLAMSFSWYIYTSTAGPFDKIVNIGENVRQNFFAEFFTIESRGKETAIAFGGSSLSLLHDVSRIFFLVTEFFIIIGFLALVLRRTRKNFDFGYKTILYSAMLLFFVIIAVPNLAPSLRVSRFYNILLIFLAPLFVLGIQAFSTSLPKLGTKLASVILISAILVPFFLFQTGFIYEIGGDPYPTTPSLSKYRMGNTLFTHMGFVRESDVSGAIWFSNNVNVERAQIYADLVSESFVLRSYGMVPSVYIFTISNESTPTSTSYAYLSIYNESVIAQGGEMFNLTELPSLPNTIYSNGISSIQLVPTDSTLP